MQSAACRGEEIAKLFFEGEVAEFRICLFFNMRASELAVCYWANGLCRGQNRMK